MPKWEYATLQVKINRTSADLYNLDESVTVILLQGLKTITMLDKHEFKGSNPRRNIEITIIRALNELGSDGWDVFAISEQKTMFSAGHRGYKTLVSDWIDREYHIKRQVESGGN